MRRLCTLACLTLVWLLAFPTVAFAHCHGSVTYGLMSDISDCGKAALLAIGAGISAAASAIAFLLGTNYYLKQLKLEYWHQGKALIDAAEDTAKIASALVGSPFTNTATPSWVGPAIEWGARAAHLATPGLRLGWQWANEVTIRIGRFIGFW
jgi:hypothetical protein